MEYVYVGKEVFDHIMNCFRCGYFHEEKTSNGNIRYYCNDRDCTVDPYDPECNYDD